jgi:hypothetical protein
VIRFIDLRGQILDEEDDAGESLPIEKQQPDFAFFDTVTSHFIDFSGIQNFASRADFRDWYERSVHNDPESSWTLDRFERLMPEWVP